MENENKNKIEDFGQKIGGAKKDLAAKKKQNLTIQDTANWSELERKEYIKKKAVWIEPDYKAMVDSGVDKVCAYYIKIIRDKIPAKPILGWSVESDNQEQNDYIKFVSDIRDMALQIRTKADMRTVSEQIIKTYTYYDHYRLTSNNSYFTNKLYRALRMNYNTVECEMKNKQFLWSKEEKMLDAYDIRKVISVEHNKDWNRLDVLEERINGFKGKQYFYDSENNRKYFSENEWETEKYFVYDKNKEILDINFDSIDDAKNYILKYGSVENAKKETNRRKRFIPPLLEVIRREGSNYRNNSDADGKSMLDSFGFYGGEFGNWERQTERQMNLNFAYDAFKDLAYALDIEDKDVSLGGNLSLAFGARGSGNALAHYERIANVINLTRMKGAGSLAHEFGHALDSFIARETGMRKSFATETFCDITDKVMDAIKYKESENGWREYTEFYYNAKAMDGEYTGYWASNVELFARAFACYIKDKLAEKGMQNDYLCGHCESAGTSGEERVRINKAFDEMFAALKEREILHSVAHDVVKNAIIEEQIVEENKTVKQKVNTNEGLLNVITDAIPDILTAEEYDLYKDDLAENISHLSDQNKLDNYGLGISPILRFEKIEFEAGTEFNINGTLYKAISADILATKAITTSRELEEVFNNDFSSQKTWEEAELRSFLSEKWVNSYILNNKEVDTPEEKKTVAATDLKVGDVILINSTTMMDRDFKPVEIAPELVCVSKVNEGGISFVSYDDETNTTTYKSSGFIEFALLEKTGFEYKGNSIDIESEKPVEIEKPIRIDIGVIGTDEPIANKPRKFFEEIIQSAGLEPTEDITVDETKKMFSSLRVAEIKIDENEYSLQFDVEDDGLIIKDSAANKEYICIWGLARELMSMIAYDNNISRENFISNYLENEAAEQEKVFHSPVENEISGDASDFTDCIDYLKGRMGISGSLLGKMSKWDYSDDDKDKIYDEWVSDYSDKVGYIYNPDYIHYGTDEQPYKNKAFYDYYLAHKDEVLREVFDFVYAEAKVQGDKVRKLLADEVLRGSGFQDGKFRINEFYSKNKDINEFAQFLKNEYGTGGHSGEGEVKFADHDGKGIEIITRDDMVYDFKWNEVAKAIAFAIDANIYITEEDVAKRIHYARFHLENYSGGMSEQERKYYTDILSEYQLGVATIYEQELIDLVKEQIKEDDGVFSDHYSITDAPYSSHLPEGTMRISEIETKFHVADYLFDAEKGEFIVLGHTNPKVREMIKETLEAAEAEKIAEPFKDDESPIYEEVSITQADIDILRTLPARKSVLNFTDEERAITKKWADHYENEIAQKSPYFRAENGDWRVSEKTTISVIEIPTTDKDFKTADADIKSFGIARGNVVNNDTLWNIQISRRGLGDTLTYARRHNDISTFNSIYSIKEIVSNSVLLDTVLSEKNNKNKADKTAYMHKMYSVIRFNGEPYIAKLSIEEMMGGNNDTIKRLYNLQDIKIEPLRHATFTNNRLAFSVLNGTEISIAQLFDIVKTNDKDFYLNKREKNDLSHSPVGNKSHNQEQQTPKREQSDARKGKSAMNNVIVGTIDYKNIKVKKFINNISIEDCQKAVDELTVQGVPFSGLLQYKLQKGTITVSPENYKAACDVLTKVRSNSPVEKKNTIIGNKPYKYISDKKFIKANEADIRKLADILTEQNVQFSGCIYSADNATITVSGAETEKLAAAYLNYVRNTSIVNNLSDYNFTLVDVQALTVKDKNDNTMSFDSYEDMENAFNDIENEFFHPTYYQLGIVTDAIAEVYAVRAMDSTTGKEKHIEKDADGYYLTFDTVTDAISYVQSNNISIANTDTELEDWKKRDAAIHMDKMQDLINQFGDEEHLIIRPDETISWTYFNPDGNGGNGQLVEMEINESVVTEAYEAYRVSNDFDEFTNYIFSNAETYLIDADREDFEAHAKQFIAEKDNDDVYILTTYSDELIERLTDNFTDIKLAKQAEKLNLEAISAETAYDMAVQADMSIYDKEGNAVAVEELHDKEIFAAAADVQKWGQIETISNFVDEINSYVSDNPSVNITEYQRDAGEEGYEYAMGASEWENTARSLAQGKYEWLKTWLNDVKYNTIFNDITVLTENAADILSDYEETYYAPDKAELEAAKETEDIEKIIADKQNEMKDAMNAGNYAKVSELAQELNALTSQKKEQETAAHSPVGNEPKELITFIDDEEKMRDFRELTKEEFLESYSYITEAEYDMTDKEYYWRTTVPVAQIKGKHVVNALEANLFSALEYDVNKEFADFVGSMDFEVIKVGNKFSLRDDANFGDIHSDNFDDAAAMTDRLDIYINDYYIEDIAGQMKEAGLDDIINIDEMTSLESIYNAINANSADERMKKFFADNLSDMRKLDLVINKLDAVDLNIAFKDAKIEPTYTIYQLKDGESTHYKRFEPFANLKRFNLEFDRNEYEEVYSGKVSDISRGASKNWVLNDIYTKFNDNNRPDDFEGHSLSMSDVVILEDENGKTANYIERVGSIDVTDLFFEVQKEKIDISKLSEITLVEDYDRRKDQPDDFIHIHNTITFSNLNSSFHIDRFKDSTLEYDVMPDVDEGHTEETREGMLIEIKEWLEDMRSNYSDKSIVITDTDGKETTINGQMFEFEASEDRLAFIIPDVGYVSIFERDDGYDYTIFDGNFKEIDGGVYDDTSISIREALKNVMEDNSLDITKCSQISYEQFEESKNIRAVEDGVIGSNGYAIDEQYKMFEDENGIYGNEVEETVEAMKIPDEVMESDAVEAEPAENLIEDESGVYDEEIEETVEVRKIEASEGDGIAADEIEAVVSEMKEKSKASLGTHSPVENETPKPVLNSPSEIKPGDQFTKNGEVYTVVEKPSLYPDDVVVKRTVTTPRYSYDTTHNVGRNELFSSYTYIGDGTENKVEPDVSKKPSNAVSRDFRIASDDFNNGGGLKTRFRQNIEAIKTLKAIESEGRTATADEQAVLAKYVGWGGIQEAFDDTKPEWISEYNELKSLLTEREYADAKGSVNNAHYTSPVVINAIYSALENIGFKGGKILEPAMGTGNFFGTMPEEMKNNSTLSGVELDDITGRIAKQLYQSANITVSGFENTNFTNDYFDAAIGNVPFGDYKVYDKEYNELNFKIHDYFFAKTLDKVHPGGVVAFITSQGTMDKKDETVRKYLAQRADLLGAIRLPNNAFKGIAGTEVTTDIIFLQKRDRAIEIDADWIGRDELDNGVMVNKYFADHPEMILGEMVEGNKMFGSGTMCVPIEGADLKEQLAEAVKNIKGEYKEQSKEQKAEQKAVVYAPVDSKKFSFVVQEEKLFYRKGGNTMSPADVKARDIPQIKALCEIREKLNKLLDVQVNNLDGINADAIANELNGLNRLYDDYVAKYGRISAKETASIFGEDASYQLVKALEVNDSNGSFERKADVMQKALIKPKQVVQHVDNANDALLVSLAEKFKVDITFMANITGMDEAALISELEGKIYQNPAKDMRWETADEYLSGNVREKLDAARDAGLRNNVAALENVIPETVEAVDIKVRLGASWIDPKYMRDFILDTFKIHWASKMYQTLDVEYSEKTNDWKISGYKNSDLYYNVLATEVYGTKELNALQILDRTLNLKTIEIKKDKLDEYGNPVLDIDGRPVRVIDQKATELAQAKQEMLQNKFREWLFDDPDRRADLVDKYNRLFNNTVLREYDGSHLNFVGMNENINLNPHQVNAVARGLSGGNTLLAHEVGAGKTFEMIAIAMEGKRLGLHNKSMIAVPNHLTEQTGQAFRELYPACNILVATEKDFKPENRKAMMAKIATGDWDAVIVGHSQFDMCALSAEKQIEYINEELDDLEYALEGAKRDGNKSLSVKAIERAKKSLEEKLLKLNDKQRKDDFIEFEKLGIDKLFIDESQEYKNLSTATKMNNVSGVVSKGSAKALQLLMKCKYMDEVTGGNGIVFASGTPISNSMTEMYTLSRYLQADKLKEMGIDSFDKWASIFGETETAMEVKPTGDGQYQNKTRFAHFINLPELQTMFRETADVKLASSLNIERPKAKIHNINVPASRYQRRFVKKLGKRSEKCRIGAVDKHIDNMLKITTDGRKIGLDARCIDPNVPDDPASKVNVCINNVFDIWQKTAENRSTQLIFCDLATPQKLKNEDRYLIFRKQEDGTYANIYSGGIRTKDKSPERVLESLKKKLPKDFVEDEMCGVLAEGDIIVSKVVDIEGGMIEHSGIVIGEGGTSKPITSVELNEIGTPPEVLYEQEKTFCVYDDIKEKLIKMGVPEKEIAFIHDCKNNEEKQQLFDKMNKGEVRIMIGSTQKCGAGMNAQAKMIALHDLDAPYRPSDMGQRHGRIERRGNENKEVDIYRYMTEKTFDSYLYQLLENKQTFISQIMTEKTALRVCEDIDEAVLDFADAKAICSGNPLAKEKGELMKDISKLNNLKSDHNSTRYRMQDSIKDAPRKLSICEKAINLYEQDKATILAAPKVKVDDKEVYPVTIRGKEYANRAEGGKALIYLLDSNKKELLSGRTVEVGKYRGMTINAIAAALGDGYSKEIKLEVVGARRYYTTGINFDSTRYEGNLIRIDNVLDKIDNLILDAKNDMAEIKQSVADAEKAINTPFEHEAELEEKTARLEAVNAELLAADNEKNASLAIYETLSFIVPEIEELDSLNKEEFVKYYISEKNTQPFVVESLGNGEFFASREDKCNGDVMMRGGATFKINKEEKTVELTSYRDDYNGDYVEFSSENPAQLGYLKNFLEELELIDDNEYNECSSDKFHEKLNATEAYISRLGTVEAIADKIQEAFDNGKVELDKDEHSVGSQVR